MNNQFEEHCEKGLTGKPTVMGILTSKTTIWAAKWVVTGMGASLAQSTDPVLTCKMSIPLRVNRTESPAAAHRVGSSFTSISMFNIRTQAAISIHHTQA